jgi:hypothetical protein
MTRTPTIRAEREKIARTTKGRFMATTDSSAPAHPSNAEELRAIARLEERLAHELMDHDERQELRDRVLRLRRRLSH